jgi:cytochrome c biogenesis protein CcmG, thiol:disulfide interchange protein DsbE
LRLFSGVLATVLAAGLLSVLGWGLTHAPRPATPHIGGAAPDVTVELLDGSSTHVAALRGAPLVVNFWATWCADCTREAAALRAAAKAHPEVRFLGVLYQDTASAGRSYQAGPGAYPYSVGWSDGAGAAFGVQANPETFFIDARGTVRAVAIGPLTQQQLADDLDKTVP